MRQSGGFSVPYGFGGDASGGYGFGGETGGGVSEFGGFFFKTRAKSIDIVSEGVYYSGIIDEKAPETVPFALDGDRTSAADVFMRETRGEFCMRGREMKWRYLEQLFSFQI